MMERSPCEMLPCSYLNTFIIASRGKYTSLMGKKAVRLKENCAETDEIRILSLRMNSKKRPLLLYTRHTI